MHKSEKWKWSHSVVSDSSLPHGLQPTRLLLKAMSSKEISVNHAGYCNWRMADQGHRHGQPSIRGCGISHYPTWLRASLAAQSINNLPAMQETQVQLLSWEDALEKGTATHSTVLAWRIPWKEEPKGLQSMGHKESDTTVWLSLHHMAHHSLCHLLTGSSGENIFPLGTWID